MYSNYCEQPNKLIDVQLIKKVQQLEADEGFNKLSFGDGTI